jgi:hypothetical protein
VNDTTDAIPAQVLLRLLVYFPMASNDTLDPPLPTVRRGGKSLESGWVRGDGLDRKVSVDRRDGLGDVLDEQAAGAEPARMPQFG